MEITTFHDMGLFTGICDGEISQMLCDICDCSTFTEYIMYQVNGNGLRQKVVKYFCGRHLKESIQTSLHLIANIFTLHL